MSEAGVGEILLIGLCLVFVFEGLMLAALAARWQKIVSQMATLDPAVLRWVGVGAMLLGLVGIQLLTR